MVGLVIVMHAPLGQAFLTCAEHVLGQRPVMSVFDIAPDDSTEEMADHVLARLTQPGHDGTLVLCDIFGATPFNIASQALRRAREQGAAGHLVTGVNLCMVLKALTDRRGAGLDELAEKVRQSGVRGIVSADCALPS